MKKPLNLNLFFSLVITFCAGCSSLPGQRIATATSLPDTTVSPTLSLPVTPSPSATIRPSCDENVLSSPEKHLLSGSIALSGYLDYSGAPMDAPSYLLQLESNAKIHLPQKQNTSVTQYAVSPDQSKIAYLQDIDGDPEYKKTLTIVSNNGEKTTNIHLSQMDIRDIAWLNHDQLVLTVLRENRFEFPEKPQADVWLMDLTTLQTQKLPNEFPEQVNDGPFSLLYHPKADVVAYLASIYSSFASQHVLRVFYVETQEILAEMEITDNGDFVAWSSDGQRLAFSTNTNREEWRDEIFVFTLGGQFTQITVSSQNFVVR